VAGTLVGCGAAGAEVAGAAGAVVGAAAGAQEAASNANTTKNPNRRKPFIVLLLLGMLFFNILEIINWLATGYVLLRYSFRHFIHGLAFYR
jgi:hypothetical protein